MSRSTLPCFLVIFLWLTFLHTGAQTNDQKELHFDGEVSGTNNGFSQIPVFSLGKPAVIANLSAGGERFSFDPQFRFAMDGLRPWSLIFTWRYKLIDKNRWTIKLGTQFPVYSFAKQSVQYNGVTQTKTIVRRFLTPEFTANYDLSRKIELGLYYFHGFGLDSIDVPKNTNYLNFRPSLNHIRLLKKVEMKWSPQFIYLNIDGDQGFFIMQVLALYFENLPFYLSSMVNTPVKSEIEAKKLNWNVNLVFSFENKMTLKRKKE